MFKKYVHNIVSSCFKNWMIKNFLLNLYASYWHSSILRKSFVSCYIFFLFFFSSQLMTCIERCLHFCCLYCIFSFYFKIYEVNLFSHRIIHLVLHRLCYYLNSYLMWTKNIKLLKIFKRTSPTGILCYTLRFHRDLCYLVLTIVLLVLS